MLTKIHIKNFKLFTNVEIELGNRVVLVGPNNSGKTSILQALTLWYSGIKKWIEKRGTGKVPKKRSGVTINRRDLIAIPIPTVKLLWYDLNVRSFDKTTRKTNNIRIHIDVEGILKGNQWQAPLEFDYANEESFYCRPPLQKDGTRKEIPAVLTELKMAYLPPMSGLASQEVRLDEGALAVRIGEGRTAEVLRNLCWQVFIQNKEQWRKIQEQIKTLFGDSLLEPVYNSVRGEIVMYYKNRKGVKLDISSMGRGEHQVLLLLTYMAANPGAILLLDEPDAHLEILRQRQIYQMISEKAEETGSQIIIASHSEIILNEACEQDTVIAFIGKPHRIDDRSQVLKALKDLGFEHYVLAQQVGWVLYLEGPSDLNILRAFAKRLKHHAQRYLERPFVFYVGNKPSKAFEHFYAVREAKPDLKAIAIYDRLDREPPANPDIVQLMWSRKEIENYICSRKALLAWAEAQEKGPLLSYGARKVMEETIDEISQALESLGKPSPWGPDLKVSDDFLIPLFNKFFKKLRLSYHAQKTDFHALVQYIPKEKIDKEVIEKLNKIVEVAQQARPASSVY